MRKAKGIPLDVDVHKAGQSYGFLVPVSEMVTAFWRSKHGQAMQVRQNRRPWGKDVGVICGGFCGVLQRCDKSLPCATASAARLVLDF